MGIEQEMATYHQNEAPADLGRAALLGGTLGVGGGILSGLVGDLQNRRNKRKVLGQMAPPVIDVGVPVMGAPVMKAADLGSVAGDAWTNFWERAKTDPLYSTKMIGAFGAPLAAGYMGTRWLNKKKNQVLQQDALTSAKQDYHAALQDFAGQKVAGEKSALDKLAEERTGEEKEANQSRLPYLAHLPAGLINDPLASLYAGIVPPQDVDDYYRNRGRANAYVGNTMGGATLGMFGGGAAGALAAGMTNPKFLPHNITEGSLQATTPQEFEQAGLAALAGTAGGSLLGLLGGGVAGAIGTRAFEKRFGKKKAPVEGEQKAALLGNFLGTDSPGETLNKGTNLYLPALLATGGLGAVLGYNRAKKNDRSKDTMDAIRDWDRKQFYAAPPVVQAAPVV